MTLDMIVSAVNTTGNIGVVVLIAWNLSLQKQVQELQKQEEENKDKMIKLSRSVGKAEGAEALATVLTEKLNIIIKKLNGRKNNN